MGNIIQIETIEEHSSSAQLAMDLDPHEAREEAYRFGVAKTEKADILIDTAVDFIQEEVTREISTSKTVDLSDAQRRSIAEKIIDKIQKDKDLSETYGENAKVLSTWIRHTVEEIYEAAKKKFIPIPQLKITDEEIAEYGFADFDLNVSGFNHIPIENDLLIQNLEDPSDLQRIKGDVIDFEGYNPTKVILTLLRAKPEIDYQKCSDLLFKLITQALEHYKAKYGTNRMQNIVMMNKKDIAEKIYRQMMQDNHFYCKTGFIRYSISEMRDFNLAQSYTWKERINLYGTFEGNIKSILFDGIKKGVFSSAKFDSLPELILARILDKDGAVINWLRPAQQEFNLTYNRGQRYVPDFVVETKKAFYIVEVKGEDKIDDADVIAKKRKGSYFLYGCKRLGKGKRQKAMELPLYSF